MQKFCSSWILTNHDYLNKCSQKHHWPQNTHHQF
jgi:hypothetical protein